MWFLLLMGSLVGISKASTEANLFSIQRIVEEILGQGANEMMGSFQERCSPSSRMDSMGSNVHTCWSSLVDPRCQVDGSYNLCSNNGTLTDFTKSSVSFPLTLEEMAISGVDMVPEISYTRALDRIYIDAMLRHGHALQLLGIPKDALRLHYGAERNGFFRIIPSIPLLEGSCEDFDVRLRPYYKGGVSSRKNVMVAVDISRSTRGLPLMHIKEGLKRLLGTLTPLDRVAVIPFASTATPITVGGNALVDASPENIQKILDQVDLLIASGSTNYTEAFRAIEETAASAAQIEDVVECATAVTFLSDGLPSVLPNSNRSETEAAVVEQLVATLDAVEVKMGHPVKFFPIAVSEEANGALLKKMACSVGEGYYSSISDTSQIPKSLLAFYQVFAAFLGDDSNTDLIVWSGPYHFATGNITGLTASLPVYDHATNPPTLIGVLSMDVPLFVLSIALGEELEGTGMLKKLLLASQHQFPNFQGSDCQIESIREQFSPAGICGSDCNSVHLAAPGSCSTHHDLLPFFHDLDRMTKGVCCSKDSCCSEEEVNKEGSDDDAIENDDRPSGDPESQDPVVNPASLDDSVDPPPPPEWWKVVAGAGSAGLFAAGVAKAIWESLRNSSSADASEEHPQGVAEDEDSVQEALEVATVADEEEPPVVEGWPVDPPFNPDARVNGREDQLYNEDPGLVGGNGRGCKSFGRGRGWRGWISSISSSVLILV